MEHHFNRDLAIRERFQEMEELDRKTLNLSGIELEELPEIPEGVQILKCGQNNLTKITKLPDSLLVLNCYDNQLTELPARLPSGLIHLNCQINKLKSLPPLPSTLQTLMCSSNQITELPDFSPDSQLKELSYSFAPLEKIGSLPPGLEVLEVNNTNLRSLPKLPRTLRTLIVNNCPLDFLPLLPSGLITLRCNGTNISEIPDLPDSLENFSFGENMYLKYDYQMIYERYVYELNSYSDLTIKEIEEKFKHEINKLNAQKRGRNLAAFQQTLGRPGALIKGKEVSSVFSNTQGAMSVLGSYLSGERGNLRNQREALKRKDAAAGANYGGKRKTWKKKKLHKKRKSRKH